MVTPLTLFPTPYPDETLYSVICRYDFRKSRRSFRGTSEEMFGKRIALNTNIPQCVGRLAKHLPQNSGLTSEYLINSTTSFPYFVPFLTTTRKDTFMEYMQSDTGLDKRKYFALGISKLRQPKNLYLRFCKSCWKEDIHKYGEPYWRRVHQLPGVLMCHHHGEPLMDSPVHSAAANNDLFIASKDMIKRGAPCGNFKDTVAEHLLALSADSEWLMEHGGLLGSCDMTLEKYDLWLRKNQFRSFSGRTRPTELHNAINSYYGETLLKQINALDEGPITWTGRIIFYADKLQHPMYHILLMRFLAETVSSFFEENCEEPLPYGQGPWPCRNPVCPNHLKEVIKKIEIRYDKSYCRALFKCPHCGFSYRRKNPIPKDWQYDGRVYISEYGPLWEAMLKKCLVDQQLTPRQTCELLQCDFYTVNKYAVRLGLWEDGAVTSYTKKLKKAPSRPETAEHSFEEERMECRKRWKQLVDKYPEANRTFLMTLDPKVYLWLRKNDLEWYEAQSPPVQYVSTDWGEKDRECLSRAQIVVEALQNAEGRPSQITKGAVIRSTGMYRLNHKKAAERLPLTFAYLAENLESADQWRRRKIRWAVKTIYEQSGLLSLAKVLTKSAISRELFEPLNDYAYKCIVEIQQTGEIRELWQRQQKSIK